MSKQISSKKGLKPGIVERKKLKDKIDEQDDIYK
jgi:hypothetical protein